MMPLINEMKTYISLSGFDTSQIVSLMVKFGIEGNDRLVLIRPEGEEDDLRGEAAIQAIQELSRKINTTIIVDIHRVDHRDFEGMVISFIDLIRRSEGEIVVNLSGGPREIFLALTVAAIAQASRISKTTNFSDIDRAIRDVNLPEIRIPNLIDDKLRTVLSDILENQPTTITEIARRNALSESTVSRRINKLQDLNAVDVIAKGKSKEVRITLVGEILLSA